MITNGKEYPATHSMSTSWYFVDKDDNVAIFDINENGPVPVPALNTDDFIEDLCNEVPVVVKDGLRMLNLTDEQVELMFRGIWKTEVDKDEMWFEESVFQIDVQREKEFLEYLAKHRKPKTDWDISFLPTCLSKNLGIYMVDIDDDDIVNGLNNPHAKYLFESGIVRSYCTFPQYYNLTDHWEDYPKFYPEANCPYYLYTNDWDAALPHRRLSIPVIPVKLSQMPAELQGRIPRLNLRFAESESIQIAAESHCYQSIYPYDDECIMAPNGEWYARAEMPSGETMYVLITSDPAIPADIPLVLSPEKVKGQKPESNNDDNQENAND